MKLSTRRSRFEAVFPRVGCPCGFLCNTFFIFSHYNEFNHRNKGALMSLNIEKDLLKSLLVMSDVIEARDTYTGGHVWRVSQLAKALALQLGLSKDEAIHISIGGYLHDLGKIGIPDIILRKPDKLTDAEFDTIKTQPIIGANLLNAYMVRK